MGQHTDPILWRGEWVGDVNNLSGSHANLFGRWVPAHNDACAQFLTALEAGEICHVAVGKRLRGFVEFVPHDEIDITLTLIPPA